MSKILDAELPWWVVTVRLHNGIEFGVGQRCGTGRPAFWKYIPAQRGT